MKRPFNRFTDSHDPSKNDIAPDVHGWIVLLVPCTGTRIRTRGIARVAAGCGRTAAPDGAGGTIQNNDLGITGPDFFGQHAAFGSVVQYFCGDDAALRKEFARTFAKYLVANHDGLYPGYVQPEHANCTLYTYRIPYEYSQDEFQQWLARHTGKRDICEPAGRRFNDYRGPVVCPWLKDGVPDDAFLKQSFGYAAYVQGRSIVLLCDNRFNPLRWVAPVNEVHHHGSPRCA